MWCERIVRNLADGPPIANRHAIDYVDVQWDQCKSVLKTRTRGGEEVHLLLPRPQRPRHGDVLFEDDSRIIVINVLPAPMMVVRPPDARTMALLALELGNLHWPTQITDREIIFPTDERAMNVVKSLGLEWDTEQRQFEPWPITEANIAIGGDVRILRGAAATSPASAPP